MANLENRFCFVILEDSKDENGYIPCVVEEGEPGYSPMTGNGRGAAPWYWGRTLEEAEAVAARYNTEQLHLTEEDVARIVASSVAAQLRQHKRKRS